MATAFMCHAHCQLHTQHTHTLAHTFLKEFIESEFILNHDQFTILHCIDIWAESVCNGVTNHVFRNAVIHYWNWHKLNKIMYILYHFEGFHWLRIFSFRSYSTSFTHHWIFGVNITRTEIYLFFLHSQRIHLLTTIYGEKKTEYKTHTYATWIEGKKPSTFVFNQQMKTMHTVSWGNIALPFKIN